MDTKDDNTIAMQINLHDDGGAIINKRDNKKINHDKEPVQLTFEKNIQGRNMREYDISTTDNLTNSDGQIGDNILPYDNIESAEMNKISPSCGFLGCQPHIMRKFGNIKVFTALASGLIFTHIAFFR